MNENGLYLAGIQFICRSQNDLYVYLSGDSILKSADAGESWQTALQLPQGVPVVSMANNGNTINIYSETGYKYYHSEDGSTVEIDSINAPLNFDGFTDLHYTKNNTYGLLDIGFAFCSSNNGGKTWDTIKWADDYDNGIYRCYFGDFAVDGSNIILSLLHYVQYPYTTPQSYSSILYSHDGGITFSESSSYSAHNGPSGSESAYIYHTALLGNKALAIGPLLYKSNDAGVTWYQDSLVSDSLIAMYVIAPNFVVLSASGGEILFSADTGSTFSYITGNFPDIANQFYFLGTHLYAVTSNSGIWKMDAAQLGIPNNYYITQLANGTSQAVIFPNPARNSITINLAADIDISNVDYKIYNTLGQLLANGTTQVNGGTFSLSTASFLKGVYYLQLQNINDNKGIKFVVD